MNKKRELRNNKNVNNDEYLLKRMLYFPGNGQGLLSAFGVSLVCHASNVLLFFFCRKMHVRNKTEFLQNVIQDKTLVLSGKLIKCMHVTLLVSI